MTNLHLLLVGAPAVKIVVEEYITTLLPNVSFEIKEKNLANSANIRRAEIGYELTSFVREAFRDTTSFSNTLVFTKHPLSTGKRINYFPEGSDCHGIGVVTLKALNTEALEGQIASLVYFAILQHLAGNKVSIEHDSNCIGNALQGYQIIASQKLCEQCILPSPDLRYSYEEEMQRLSDLVYHYSKRHHVILVHGIRTNGEWTHSVSEYLEKLGYNVTIEGYKRFSLLKLLGYWIIDTGKKERQELKEAIRRRKAQSPHSKISVIAHSHGTLLVSKLLKEQQIKINNLLLCGSIIPRGFKWGDAIERGLLDRVLNVAGRKDIWAALAENWVRNAGGSGLLGFQSEPDQVRTFMRDSAGHSTSLKDIDHRRSVWMPFLEKGYLPKQTKDKQFKKEKTTLAALLSQYLLPKYFIISGLLYFCFECL